MTDASLRSDFSIILTLGFRAISCTAAHASFDFGVSSMWSLLGTLTASGFCSIKEDKMINADHGDIENTAEFEQMFHVNPICADIYMI